MKREITQKELDIIVNDYGNEELINTYKLLLDYVNNSRFVLIYPEGIIDFLNRFNDWTGRFGAYIEGIKEDTNSENADENYDFAIEITHVYLNGNTLIEFYKFAVKNNFDLRILNGEKKLIVYFKKIEDKEERMKSIFSKRYLLGKYSLRKIYEERFYHPKDVKLYFENLIEAINYNYSALLIKNHFNQHPIKDCIEECIDKYERKSLTRSKLNIMDRYYLQNSSIFNYLQPIIDAERGYTWKYDGNIDNAFYYVPTESTVEDDEYYDVERTEESKIEDFIVSYIENDGHIKARLYVDSYKNSLPHPLPFQMIDYQCLSQKECEDKIVYIYRLSTFTDSYMLHKIFHLYYIIQSFIDLKAKFVVKPIETKMNKNSSLLKTTKCCNPYLCTLFELLPHVADVFDDETIFKYEYNNEYINFFFYIIESKNKRTLDFEAYLKEEEAAKEEERRNQEECDREEELRKASEDFIKSMDRDFPGWSDGL